MPDFTIRGATLDDLPIIRQHMMNLYSSDRHYDTLFTELSPEANAEEEYTPRILGADGVCFVAEHEGAIIGCLTGMLSEVPSEVPSRRTRLEKIFIQEEFRGQGVGSALVDAFLAWNRKMGVSRVFVRTFAENKGAIELYERLGFKPYILGLVTALDEEETSQS
jgi:GNAT superfamily N-acetyltransferase